MKVRIQENEDIIKERSVGFEICATFSGMKQYDLEGVINDLEMLQNIEDYISEESDIVLDSYTIEILGFLIKSMKDNKFVERMIE